MTQMYISAKFIKPDSIVLYKACEPILSVNSGAILNYFVSCTAANLIYPALRFKVKSLVLSRSCMAGWTGV